MIITDNLEEVNLHSIGSIFECVKDNGYKFNRVGTTSQLRRIQYYKMDIDYKKNELIFLNRYKDISIRMKDYNCIMYSFCPASATPGDWIYDNPTIFYRAINNIANDIDVMTNLLQKDLMIDDMFFNKYDKRKNIIKELI